LIQYMQRGHTWNVNIPRHCVRCREPSWTINA
jgi:hypothetical protein